MKKFLLSVLFILLVSTNVYCEPDKTFQYLINEPVSLLDLGIFRLNQKLLYLSEGLNNIDKQIGFVDIKKYYFKKGVSFFENTDVSQQEMDELGKMGGVHKIISSLVFNSESFYDYKSNLLYIKVNINIPNNSYLKRVYQDDISESDKNFYKKFLKTLCFRTTQYIKSNNLVLFEKTFSHQGYVSEKEPEKINEKIMNNTIIRINIRRIFGNVFDMFDEPYLFSESRFKSDKILFSN